MNFKNQESNELDLYVEVKLSIGIRIQIALLFKVTLINKVHMNNYQSHPLFCSVILSNKSNPLLGIGIHRFQQYSQRGDKERFDKEQISVKELFTDYQPFYTINLLLDFLPIQKMTKLGVSEQEIVKISKKKGTLEIFWTNFGALRLKEFPKFMIHVFCENFLEQNL